MLLSTILLLVAVADAAAAEQGPVMAQPEAHDAPLPAGVDGSTGFRMKRYRAPVPAYNPGAETVNTTQALTLNQSGEVMFIDVYPPRGLGADPISGEWIITEQHEYISGSVWLPEVGRGYLEEGHVSYFKRNLARLTHNDTSTAILFYCTADCWQSWNAARRAVLWGYTNVFWYPDGTDGWRDHGLPLVTAVPVNFLAE